MTLQPPLTLVSCFSPSGNRGPISLFNPLPFALGTESLGSENCSGKLSTSRSRWRRLRGPRGEARSQTTGFTGRLRSGKPAQTLLRRLFLPRRSGEPTHAARFDALSACWQRQWVCWWRGRSMTGCRDARARSSASGRRCQETGAQPAVDLPVVQERCPAMGAVHRRPRAAARAPDLQPVGAPLRRNDERGWAH